MKHLIVLSLIIISGCSTIMPQTTQEIAKYIDTYCLTVDPVMRESMRNEVNVLTKVGNVEITCE